MAEYIDRDVAKDELLSWAVCIKHPEHLMKEDAMHILDSIPAADVVEVVHARWETIPGTKSRKHCTNCDFSGPEYIKFYDYCPTCGARMDGAT